MKKLHQTEFMQYLYSEKDYEELVYLHRQKIHDMYQDISPYILIINPDTGMNHKVGQSVENHAISLVDLRHALAEQRKRHYKRVQIYRQALKSLQTQEIGHIEDFKNGVNTFNRKEQSAALKKLKAVLEPLIFAYEMKQALLEEEEKAKRIESVRQALHFIPKETEEETKKSYLINGEFRYLTSSEYAAYQANPNISDYDLVSVQH